MPKPRKFRRLADAYTFHGFRPLARIVGMFGDPRARVVTLVRRGEKTICGSCGTVHRGWYDRRRRRARDLSCGGHRIHLDLEVRRVDSRRCGGVRLHWQNTGGNRPRTLAGTQSTSRALRALRRPWLGYSVVTFKYRPNTGFGIQPGSKCIRWFSRNPANRSAIGPRLRAAGCFGSGVRTGAGASTVMRAGPLFAMDRDASLGCCFPPVRNSSLASARAASMCSAETPSSA
jgi:hypothetical protein